MLRKIADKFNGKGAALGAALLGAAAVTTPTIANAQDNAANTNRSGEVHQISTQNDRNYFSEAVLYAKNEGAVAVHVLLGENEKKWLEKNGKPVDSMGEFFSNFLEKKYGIKAKAFTNPRTTSSDGSKRNTTSFAFILETGYYHDKDLDTYSFNVGEAQKVMGGVSDLYKALRKYPAQTSELSSSLN